ncbi:MAG TPA: winged helix-turn-helix domain-containing protein [Verrucomicrobiae bacterium]|nr:winged helix-turn-helix domain-containing protein [Verrucomicrobiae bacterium]
MSTYEFGPFRLDASQLLLFDGVTPVALGPKVVETLLALVEHPGDVLPKSTLLDRIWPEGYVDEANLAQNVYVLRKLLRARWRDGAIETIPRRGYRFTAAVRLAADAPLAMPLAAPTPAPRRTRWMPAVAAAVVLLLAAGTAVAIVPRHAPSQTALSADAGRLYEIGRYYWNLRTRDGTRKSIAYFGRVVDEDPSAARGYAGLASANATMGDYDFGPEPAAVYYARARAYARKALAIDPNCGEAYAVLGMLASASPMPTVAQLTASMNDLRRAIELDPADAPAHEWYGIALLTQGRLSDAYAELHKAADLDPLSVATTAWLGHVAYLERRYGDAIGYARETLDLSPHRYDVLGIIGLAYQARGDDPRAIAAFSEMERDCVECRPEAAALLADVYARTNRQSEALAQFAIASAHASDVDPADLALAQAAIGQRRVALSRLLHLHDVYTMAEIANDPRFDAYRRDPQLAQLQQKPA